MLATALITFRETLEAALIVSIILAATRGVPRRGFWVVFGIGGGLIGAGAVAALTNFLATLFDGAGQEIVNASILFFATLLIGWHIVWMNQHGREMAAEMKKMGACVSDGTKDLSVLAIVIGLAVMREGSEVVLMLQGLWTSGQTEQMLSGGLLGASGGIFAGALLYLGFIALPIGRIFTITNGLLILIAAGMAARGANFLSQAGFIPSLGNNLWDSSGLVAEESITGKLLAALTGYVARPNGVEVAFYLLTIGGIIMMMQYAVCRSKIKGIVLAIALISPLMFVFASDAKADEVLSPYVTKGEAEIENQGYMTHDRNSEASNEQAHVGSIGYSPTDWYRVEFEGEFTRAPGSDQDVRFNSLNIENTFQLADAGEYWIDPGLFYEMDFARQSPNNIIFGFLGSKTVGSIAETFNLLLHKDYGSGNTPTGLIYSNQLKYRLRSWLEPGFEIYGDTTGKDRFQDQDFATGPGIFGKIYTFNGQALKYELAYLFGATPATPDSAVRWKLEYEFSF